MESDTRTGRTLKLSSQLCGDTWRSCVVAALTALECCDGKLFVECSELRSFDEEGLAMLIGFSRYSDRRQVRVVLANPPESLRQSLEFRGLAWLFDWSPLAG